jgi:hypothetical protein
MNWEMNTPTWLSCVGQIQQKFCIWPKYCDISGRRLWFENAYRTTRMITGPGEPVFEHRWYSKEEFLILRMKYGDFRSLAQA